MLRRVLIVNTANTGHTGITSVILNYVKNSPKFVKFDFVFNGNVEEGFKEKFLNYGENIFIPPCSRSKKPLQYMIWLAKLMKNNDYDAVHVHANSGTAYFDIHAAKIADVPIRICHSHNSSCKHKTVHRLLKNTLNRETTDKIACSDLAGKWLFNKNYVLLNNGIDINTYKFDSEIRNEYRSKLGLEESFVIGHIAHMNIEKNHLYLLDIFKSFSEENDKAKLLLIGDGRLRADIEARIREYNLEDKVLVLGKRADAASLYQCMDVFVLPSLWEGLPVTLVEAQTAGLRCIVSDAVTRLADLTGNVVYLKIEKENIPDWMSELSKVQINAEDRKKYGSVMEESDFNIANCVQRLLEIYGCR